jgi:opacity protein-like surface antigen
MKHQSKYVYGAVLAVASLTSISQAQIPNATEAFDRSHKSEIFGIGQYLHSEDIDMHSPIGNIKVKMDDTGLGGFGFAYHFSQFFSFETEFMFGNATFGATVPTTVGGAPGPNLDIKKDAFIQTSRFNLTYNIINRRITPIITAGIGYQYLDSEIESAPPQTYCWWDPFYGYYHCYTDQPHATTTDFTWNVGAGFRWNITDNFFIKAVGGANWVEYGNASGITTQYQGIFSIGWDF